MVAHDDAGSKRHRRPSVKLTEIDSGALVARSLLKNCSNKVSKNRHFTNLSSNQTLTLVETNPNNDNRNSKKNLSNVEDEDDINNTNLDNVAIGSWKSKSKKSPITKRVRSNWAAFKSKPNDIENDDKMHTTYVEDSENNEHSGDSPANDNVKRGTRVSDEGPISDGEARDWNWGSERNGVKVWLNELGLGRYAPVFEIHEVDDEVLPMLTLEDLKDMGISAVGSRRKMYCSIQKLNKGFP